VSIPDNPSSVPNRRRFLQATLISGTSAVVYPALAAARAIPPSPKPASPPSFELEEITIAQLQDGLRSGKYAARSLTEKYLGRIEALDKHGPTVNSIIEVNPDAVEIAEKLDKERKEKGSRGPLHGIPVLIKDNIDTADRMSTTAGSLALVGAKPPKDSFMVQRLRAAGAVVLGKTNLSEWANIRSGHSTSGWSGRGGLTRNPYALDRNPCGSSSGSGAATSANFCAAAIGTETDGSIVCPSSSNGLVGIKPTVGLTSRSGIIPISHSQDGAGPMARTVADAAAVLGAVTGVDPEDSATAASQGKSYTDYAQFLDPNGLRGMRIGVVRKFFGFMDDVDQLMAAAIDVMKQGGATVVDPVSIETHGKYFDSEFLVFQYELKADLNAYLARLGTSAPVHTLKEIIEFNEKNREKEMPYFGQDIFLKAEEKGPLTEKEYLDAVEQNHRLARTEGIDATMEKSKLDALIGPTGGPAWLTDLITGDHFGGGSSSPAAIAGYPSITVPAGYVHGLPVGISFFGRAWSEPTLIKIAFGYEQATKHRKPPRFLPTVNPKA
jgi:amidase